MLVFPNDKDILLAKNSLLWIRKANPKLIIYVWTVDVIKKYKTEIEEGNMDFFINNDYSQDVKDNSSQAKIIEGIDRLRDSFRAMTNEEKKTIIKYIQNLTKLADLYNNPSQPKLEHQTY